MPKKYFQEYQFNSKNAFLSSQNYITNKFLNLKQFVSEVTAIVVHLK